MDQPHAFCSGGTQEHLAWAAKTLIESLRSFDPQRLHQEVIHPRDRKALYARLLVSYFQGDRKFVISVLRELARNRSLLEELLGEKGRWANRERGVVKLEDAILLNYDGLSHPAAFQQLWDDVTRYGRHVDGLAGTLNSAEELAHESGLRAPWAAPMILAAWLRHLIFRRVWPPNLRPHSFRLWPSGPRDVHQAPSTIAIHDRWDPESQAREDVRAAIMRDVDAKLDEIVSSYEAKGYERVNVRKVGRDVEATYLRISDPGRWGWRALSERYEDKASAAIDDGAPLLSSTGVRKAVTHVLELLEIQPPTKRAGRPRKRP